MCFHEDSGFIAAAKKVCLYFQQHSA